MKLIKTEDAIGQVLCHDITQIIPGVTKDAVFRKGHIITEEDIPVLLSVGKEHIYIWEKDEHMLHENEAAQILYAMCRNEHMHPSEVKEGKIEVIADCDGLLKIDREKLKKVNGLGEMMIATRHGNTCVKEGDKLAGTRIIPLVIEKEKMERAKAVCQDGPILTLKPLHGKKVAILTTGSEVYHGRIEDKFTPVLVEKLKEYNCEMIFHEVYDDDHEAITKGCLQAIEQGAELVLCTGGMSVDPDDKTPLAIKNTGARMVSYGAPVLPGAKSGILAGVVLGIGRAIGETMAVIMVAGNQPVIPRNLAMGVRTLTSNIVMEMGYATDLHREALIATAVVLFVLILIINLCCSALQRRSGQ